MTTSIDTNVIVALWWKSDPLNQIAAEMLNQANQRGQLVVSAPVYSELMGDPGRTESELDQFFWETGIEIDWALDETVWREAGKAFGSYILRRRSGDKTFPRRIFADFLIGAHAMVRGYSLLTLDRRLYSDAFPKLKMISS